MENCLKTKFGLY
jgi:hypothetical protein